MFLLLKSLKISGCLTVKSKIYFLSITGSFSIIDFFVTYLSFVVFLIFTKDVSFSIFSFCKKFKIKCCLYFDGVYVSQKLIIDFGTNSAESVDFPVYAKKLGEVIQNEEIDLGIAICGTGIGMSIVLNKMKGVYCAKVSNESEAILCRSHNNANVIAMSEEIDHEVMKKIVNNFIETPFSNVSKYIRRNNMIKEIENE